MPLLETWNNTAQLVIKQYPNLQKAPVPRPVDVADAWSEPWIKKGIDKFRERCQVLAEVTGKFDEAAEQIREASGASLAPAPDSFASLFDEIDFLHTAIGNVEHPDPQMAEALQSALFANGQRLTFFCIQIAYALWQGATEAEQKEATSPLAPLIYAWLSDRPEILRPNVDQNGKPRTKAIIPSGLLKNPPTTLPAQLKLISDLNRDQLLLPGRIEKADGQLPLWPSLLNNDNIAITPLILADAAGFRGLQPGTGARYDKRLLIYAVINMPLDQRRPGGQYEWRPPLRELMHTWLFPQKTKLVNGRQRMVSSYRPSQHAEPVYSAMQAVNLAEILLPNGFKWRPVIVRGYPSFDDLDSEVIIQIELPAGSDHGPQVNTKALTAAGVISDPAFDLELGLAYLWDEAKAKNGGHRIYATRPEVVRNEHGHIVARGKVVFEKGRPSTRWNHPQAVRTGQQERHPQADKVRVLTRDNRRFLAYGPPHNRRQSQLSNDRRTVDRLLENLERAGRIAIERNASDPRTGKKGWRILEAWPRN